MPRVLIVDSDTLEVNARNAAAGGQTSSAIYAQALSDCCDGVAITYLHPYAGETLSDYAQFDGAVFAGSGVEWCTDDARASPLADAMEACFTSGVPTMGSCNGMQLAATVLGGSNRASPNGREDGLARDVRLTEAGHMHPFMAGRMDGFAVASVHRDEVDRLPVGAVVLATNAHSPVQAFAYERGEVRFWGVQYHPEYSMPFIGNRVRAWNHLPDHIAMDLEAAETDQDAAERLGVRWSDMQAHARLTELRNWLSSL